MTVPSTSILPAPCDRILTIIAHPDDAESFAGGTMALLAKEGRAVQYLVITRSLPDTFLRGDEG